MIRGGYAGRLLDVDLSAGIAREAPLPPEEDLRTWIGCAGLGLHLLAREITPHIKPTDPACPQFILTGPLTGTLIPQSSNWTIVGLHTGIPYHVGVTHAHGYWGARLKHAGWDGIILRGSAPAPVYLWIDDDQVELRDAGRYWGRDIFDTTRRIRQDHEDSENISVACIGPGGEHQLPGASIRCDMAYGASKSGQGEVWGAKKLKAIAVRGTRTVPIAEPERFAAACQTWTEKVYNLPDLAARECEGLLLMPLFAKLGLVPCRNFTAPELQVRWGERLAADMAQWKMEPVGSWQCVMRCHHDTTITTGPMAGAKVTGYGGEIIEEFGPNLGIEDPGTALALCGMVDGLGLDSGEVGRIIAMAMEAYNEGALTQEQTDGLDLSWGNVEAVIELLNKIVNRDGLGAILAKGLRPAARELGIERMAVHIKGVGFNDHDQRALLPMLFQSLVASGAGPTWQINVGTARAPNPDLGFAEPLDPGTPDHKAEFVYKGQVKKMWEDSVGVCMFATGRGFSGMWELVPEAVAAAVGWDDFGHDEAWLVGERIIALQRLIALYRGYEPACDFDIAERLLEPIPAGPAKGRALGPHLATLREEYYTYLGWDPATGVPRAEALERVGLAGRPIGKTAWRLGAVPPPSAREGLPAH